MADQISSPQVPIRIYCPTIKTYMFTNSDTNRRIYTTTEFQDKDDQLWSVMEQGSKRIGFQSVKTGQWMSLDHTEGDSGIRTFPTTSEFSKLLLDAGTGDQGGQFRIYCPQSRLYAVATRSSQGVVKSTNGDSDEAWWQFVYPYPEFVSWSYELDKGKVLESTTSALNDQSYDTGKETQCIFVTKTEVEHELLWKFNGSFSYPREVTGDLKVPTVERTNKLALREYSNLRVKFNETTRRNLEWNLTTTLVVPADCHAQVDAKLTKTRVEVPFIVKFKSSVGEFEERGMFHGLLSVGYKVDTNYSRSP